MKGHATGPGIYSGALSYSSQEPGDGIIDSAQLVPYPANVEATHYDDSPHTAPQRQQQNTASMTPISMATTEHHFILLYSGRLRVLRGLDDQVVYDEDLDIVSLDSYDPVPSGRQCTHLKPSTARRRNCQVFGDRQRQQDILAIYRRIYL